MLRLRWAAVVLVGGVLLFGELSAVVYHAWGMARVDAILLALAVGTIVGAVLGRVTRPPAPAMLIWAVAGGIAWIVAAYIGRSVVSVEQWGTQWWPSYWLSLGSRRTHGWDLSGGQAFAGAVAGWGSALPGLQLKQAGWQRRALEWALIGVVTAAVWAVVFRGEWVV